MFHKSPFYLQYISPYLTNTKLNIIVVSSVWVVYLHVRLLSIEYLTLENAERDRERERDGGGGGGGGGRGIETDTELGVGGGEMIYIRSLKRL